MAQGALGAIDGFKENGFTSLVGCPARRDYLPAYGDQFHDELVAMVGWQLRN